MHFDAHLDYRPFIHGVQWANGNPIRNVAKLSTVGSIVQVGIRSLRTRQADVLDSRARGNDILTVPEYRRRGPAGMLEKIPRDEPAYVSIDIDVLDPSYAPGTGTPEPGGLTTRELFPLVRGLCTEKNLVGFDLVELNPLADPGYTTALNANRAIQECLTGIAMRKKGITKPDYLSPLTVEHGRKKPN